MAPGHYEKIKADSKGLGQNAVADVGKILSLVQSMKVPEREVMKIVQEIYIKHFQAVKGGDANKARQSWVAASGNNFEAFMRNFIDSSLNAEGILSGEGRSPLPETLRCQHRQFPDFESQS